MVKHSPDRRYFAPLTLISVVGFVLTLVLASHFGLRAVRAAGEPHVQSQQQESASTQLLNSDEHRLEFLLEIPDAHLATGGDISIPGLETGSDEPGAPALPSYSTFIILPPGATATVDVAPKEKKAHDIAYIRPTPRPARQTLAEDFTALSALSPEFVYEPAPQYYATDVSYPGVLYELSEPMYYRDLRVAQLHLYPLQYNALRGVLEQFSTMQATITFHGANMEGAEPAAGNSDYLQALAPLSINYEQAHKWRSLPAQHDVPSTLLPTGQATFKISVDEDGIYEVTCQELAAAGMDIANSDPETFEMLYRGEPVAFEFIGNDNNSCDANEKIRFYGWAFDGSRLERQFLTENVYWLWAGGTATPIASRPSAAGHPQAAAFRDSMTREEDRIFTRVWTDKWEDAPNEPDTWIWQRVEKGQQHWPTLEYVHEITAPAPFLGGSSAVVTVEILSNAPRADHDVAIYFNGNPALSGELQWANPRSVNVTMTVPMTAILDGPNDVHVVYRTPVTNTTSTSVYYMNRVTIDYDRRFVAQDDQLIFDHAGSHTYRVEGFSNGTDAEVLVWDISDRLRPVRVTNVDVSDTGPPYTYEFGGPSGPASFIATHTDNMRKPLAIERYVGPSLDPVAGAEWVAISHENFLQDAQQLATHRQQPGFGGFRTHVVDVEDVINQYGYGLPIPAAIGDYMRHALFNWPVAPQYLLLMGDAHVNPRHLPCPTEAPDGNQCRHWGKEREEIFVLTDMVYTDVVVGLNASDYTFSLLAGDDLIPDIAVGRLAVQSSEEAQIILNKIMHYESTRISAAPEPWQRSILFIADDDDSAGNFCDANAEVAATIPAGFAIEEVCMASNSQDHITETRMAIHTAVNNPPNGATIMNYRGHGAARAWAGGLINLDDPQDTWTPWFNNEPLIILSMDCWDGYFAQQGYEALSEEFLAEPNHGTVAHWSSTGLGYDFEHDALHHSFYEAMFDHELTVIGEAINHAKLSYILESYHPSQLYSFVLQGDPAMEMVATGIRAYLPAVSR